jgi:hypothetical protein
MPTLPTQSFATIVQNTAAGIQGRSSKLINFAIGSTLRAIAEGFAGLFLWFQALALQLLAAIRLSTSFGTDVDTFTADFMPVIAGSQSATLANGSPRFGAQASSGLVTFSRFTAGPSTCFVPVGALVRTADGARSFTVVANTTLATFSATLGGYTMPAGVGTLPVAVQAVTAGGASNVGAGAISVIASALQGIDAVVNVAPFTNGFDHESDSALKARFVLFINALAKATEGAIGFAIANVQQGMSWQIFENQDRNGTTVYGMLTVYVDDGSGSPPPDLVTACSVAVDGERAAGVRVGVYPASQRFASVTMTLATAPGFYPPTVVAQVSAALGLYIDSLGLGATLSYMRLAQVAFDASPGVTDVLNYTLNNSQSDIVPGPGETIKAGAVIVS